MEKQSRPFTKKYIGKRKYAKFPYVSSSPCYESVAGYRYTIYEWFWLVYLYTLLIGRATVASEVQGMYMYFDSLLLLIFSSSSVLSDYRILLRKFYWICLTCIAKTKCRKFETNIPRKRISRPQWLSPNFHIHVSVNELYISTMGLYFVLEEICGLILGIYKSLTDTWKWKLGLRPRYSQKRNI